MGINHAHMLQNFLFVCFVSFLHLAANNALSDSCQESNKIHCMATIFFLITIFVLSPSTEHVSQSEIKRNELA